FLRGSSAIDLRRRESIILIVANELRCSYIRTGHANLASSLSMDRLSIVSNNADVEDAVGAEGAMALRYAPLLATGARGRRHFVYALSTTVGDAGIIELTILIGYYIMLTTVVHAVDLPLEDGALAIVFPEP